MISGIYSITNLNNGKIYIGSSVDVRSRFSQHKSGLRKSNHHNRYLQRAWDKYGEGCFEFKVIEVVEDVSVILEREQYWIDKYESYDSSIGYNISPTAGNTTGCMHTDESRKKISEAKKGFKHTDEFKKFIGECNSKRIITDETRSKLSESKKRDNLSEETLDKLSKASIGSNNPNSKLDEDKVREIKLMLKEGFTQQKIADKFGISRSLVGLIKNEERWAHITL